MRRILAAFALIPVLALLASCGGASKVTSPVASIADPKEALAASSEAMSKESYFLEYKIEFPGDDIDGSYEIARKGKDFVIHIDDKATGDFWILEVDGKSYWCMGGSARGFGVLLGGSGGDMCFKVTSDDEAADEDESGDELDSMIFDPIGTMLGEVDEGDIKVEDADDREIAGEDARCFVVTSPDVDAEVCVSKESGLLVLIDGEMDGEEGTLTLKSSREPKDDDFELPYDVTDDPSTFGSSDPDDMESPEPEQPDKPGIEAIRIAGQTYPWESGQALCPDLELESPLFDLEVLPGGKFAIDETIVDKDCTTTEDPDGFATRVYDAKGNAYLAGFDGVIARVAADGTRTVIAGHKCTGSNCDFSKDDKTEGPALDVEIFGVAAMAVTGDTVWFVAQAYSEDDDDEVILELRRISGGRVETIPSTRDEDDWIDEIFPGPNGSLYVAYWDEIHRLDMAGKSTKVSDDGTQCIAAGPDGTLWSYGWFDNEISALLPGGERKSFPFQPDASDAFYCAGIAVEANGNLLFLGDTFGEYPGLWRIPNPLK